MSAWGITNFENDVALQLVEQLTRHEKIFSVDAFFESFSNVFDPEQTTLDECLEAITMVEIFAAIQGSPDPELPLELKDWLELSGFQIASEQAAQATKIVEMLMKESEVKEMYVDTPYYKAWKKVQDDLIKRLKS